MPDRNPPAAADQLGVIVHGVSPLIWRWLLVPGGASIAGLHAIVQAAFGWSGEHLHYFTVHGARYASVSTAGRFSATTPTGSVLPAWGCARESGSPTPTTSSPTGGWTCAWNRSPTPAVPGCIRGAPAVAAPDRRRIGPGRGTTCSGPSRIWWMRRSRAPRTSSVSC